MFVLRILARLVVFAIVATLAFSVVRAAAVGTWFHPGIALGVNDSMRTDAALKGISGKRLTYRGPRTQEVH